MTAHAKCRMTLGGTCFCVVVSATSFLAPGLKAAEFAHYPGAWLDTSNGEPRDGAVYVSSDRFERVHSFYRQFLFELPSAAGVAWFCLDPADRPDGCRRFVELRDLSGVGVGTRIKVFQSR